MDQPLLERDAPLAELESLAWMAASGTGHAVFITGETGAGKTTLLLRAFEARAGGAHVLHAPARTSRPRHHSARCAIWRKRRGPISTR